MGDEWLITHGLGFECLNFSPEAFLLQVYAAIDIKDTNDGNRRQPRGGIPSRRAEIQRIRIPFCCPFSREQIIQQLLLLLCGWGHPLRDAGRICRLPKNRCNKQSSGMPCLYVFEDPFLQASSMSFMKWNVLDQSRAAVYLATERPGKRRPSRHAMAGCCFPSSMVQLLPLPLPRSGMHEDRNGGAFVHV